MVSYRFGCRNCDTITKHIQDSLKLHLGRLPVQTQENRGAGEENRTLDKPLIPMGNLLLYDIKVTQPDHATHTGLVGIQPSTFRTPKGNQPGSLTGATMAGSC